MLRPLRWNDHRASTKNVEKDAPDLSVESLTESDAAIKRFFSNPEVQYIGSTSGCGCDFPHVILQNGQWPTLEDTEKDELRHRSGYF